MTLFWISLAILTILPIAFVVSILLQHRRETQYWLMITNLLLWIIIVPITSFILYNHWGDSAGLEQSITLAQQAPLIAKTLSQYKSVDQIIQQMKLTLAKQPDSAKGWYILGRLYFGTQQYAQAINAFSTANRLAPQDPKIEFQLVQAMFFHDQQTLTPQARDLLRKLQQRYPNEPEIMNLFALDAYHRGDYQQAITQFEQMLALFAPDSNQGKMIMSAIYSAQQKLQRQRNNNEKRP